MYPEFAAQARNDRDHGAEAEFKEQTSESKEHAGIFKTAAKNFGLLTPIEQHHAESYGVALQALQGKGQAGQADEPVAGKWICKVCSMIYDPAEGDPDSGIEPGTPFEAIPDDWSCPICGVRKASFVPYPGSGIKGRLTFCDGSHALNLKAETSGKIQRAWWKFWA